MTNGEIIEQLENAIELIKQDGKDWLDDRDIPILEACIKSLEQQNVLFKSGLLKDCEACRAGQEPCDDEISRQAVLDAISELNAVSFYEVQEDSRECYYEIENAIKQLPPVTPTQRWISVSEGLPEESGVYIVSYEDSVRLLEWFNGKWFFYPSNPTREETGTIIAWQPLPEPYKANKEN